MFRCSAFIAVFALFATPLIQAYSNSQMLCLVNKERSRQGLPAMGLDDLLTRAAQMHSDDQARMNSMSHSGSDGSQPSDRVTRVGFQWRSMAENVAYGYADSNTCMQAWMNSPGHRANILGNCEMFGSAVALSGSTPYYTQVFGTDSKGRRNVPKCDGSDYDTPSSGGGGSKPPTSYTPPPPSYGGGRPAPSPPPQNNYNNRPQNNYNSRPQNNYNSRPQNNYGNWMFYGGGGRNPWNQHNSFGMRPTMRY